MSILHNITVLTIAIPTYDRNDKLKRSIDKLIPQLNEFVKILVLDNASPTPVHNTLDYLADNPSVTIVRNKYNVGVSANIIRCFENCTTEWMWLLGDDDPPRQDAIAGILSDIQINGDCSFLNYKSHMTSNRMNDFYSIGTEEFIRKIDHFGNLLFISLGVYNINLLRADIRLTYQLSYCLAPHLVYLISAIEGKTKVGFLTRELHDFSLYTTSTEESWSWVSLSLCFPIIFEIPLNISEEAKDMFANLVLTHVKGPREIYSMLEQPKYYLMPTSRKRFLIRQIYFRSLLYRGLDINFMYFICYDIKFILKNIFIKRIPQNILERDSRL